MRLDSFLYENGYTSSRTEAKNLILSGAVSICGTVIKKPSFDIPPEFNDISVDKSGIKYASRGGLKLEYALDTFKISPLGKKAIDIGASSGGFTDCLLQRGALSVISLDSGKDQIMDFLRQDKRVTVLESYNARYMKPEDFMYIPNLAVMDVSFISATLIMPAVYNVLDINGEFICLIKPQFEVGRGNIGKGGIVKDNKARMMAVNNVIEFAESLGFKLIAMDKSPITGTDGNVEYLAYFIKLQ